MAAGTLKAVQSGTAQIAAGSASGTATITAAVIANSIVDFSYQCATGVSYPQTFGDVTVTFTNTTTLTFTRGVATSSPVLNIIWYVSEFTSGVTVQRGSASMTATTVNVTLSPAVVVANSWPIVNSRTTSDISESGPDSSTWVQAAITSTTNLALVIASYDTTTTTVGWQVVQYDNATTALYTTTFARLTISGTQTITAVTTTKALIYATWNWTEDVMLASRYPRMYLTNATTITFSTFPSEGTKEIKSYSIDISDAVTVQRADSAVASGNTTTNVTLTAVVTANAMAHVTSPLDNTNGSCAYTTDGRYSRNFHSGQITSTTNLALVRAESGTAATLAWEEIEWVAGAVAAANITFQVILLA